MATDLFAGIPVTDYRATVEWYQRLFGSPPSFGDQISSLKRRGSYFKGWAFWILFVGAALAITVYLMRADRGILERRVTAGPVREQRPVQRVVQSFASLTFIALLVCPASTAASVGPHVPPLVAALGDTLVVASFAAIFLCFRENSYTAGTAVPRGPAGARLVVGTVPRHPPCSRPGRPRPG